MLKNIKDWRTTIPTIAGVVASMLGLFGVIDIDAVPQLDELLAGVGFSVLTIVGLFSKS